MEIANASATGASARGCWWLVGAALAFLLPSTAFGDTEVEVGPVVTQVGDANERGASATTGGLRFGLRGTYGLSDRIAVEVGLGTTLGYHPEFADQVPHLP